MDVNFFEPIKINKKKSNIRMAMFFGVILATALAIISLSIIEIMEQRTIQESIDAIAIRNESESFIKLKDDVSELEHRIASLNEKTRHVSAYKVYENAITTGTTAMLSHIQSQITENTLLTNLSISSGIVTLEADSSSLTAMAQFSHNLANCGYFEDVSIASDPIDYNEGVYSYTINMAIVGADPKAAIAQMDEEYEIKEGALSEEVIESEEN